MLEQLRFVQGAVARKDLVPSLTHFVIENGLVRGFNGTLAICCPIPLDISCKPKAATLVTAIRNCNDAVQLSLTAKGKLSIRSGSFRALVDCVEGETPHALPEGECFAIDGESLLTAFRTLAPIVGDDASRMWSNGILLKGSSAFATNSVILAEYWTGVEFPHVVNVPGAAVKELLRIGEPPVSAQIVPGNNMTFHYSGNRWIRTQLYITEWPDVSAILNRDSVQVEFPTAIFDAVETVKPFVDKIGRIYFSEQGISTEPDRENCASYDINNFNHSGIYNYEMLMKLKGVAKTIDFSQYPAPCLFMGDRVRGAIIGIKAT
jgi:DNA polymerase III sliding clamp (beta) subunit (PCNA family)